MQTPKIKIFLRFSSIKGTVLLQNEFNKLSENMYSVTLPFQFLRRPLKTTLGWEYSRYAGRNSSSVPSKYQFLALPVEPVWPVLRYKSSWRESTYSENGLLVLAPLIFTDTLLSTKFCFNPMRSQQIYGAMRSSVTRDQLAVNYCRWPDGSPNLISVQHNSLQALCLRKAVWRRYLTLIDSHFHDVKELMIVVCITALIAMKLRMVLGHSIRYW
jgi:hypothetical protein